jgi:hypothetical protein
MSGDLTAHEVLAIVAEHGVVDRVALMLGPLSDEEKCRLLNRLLALPSDPAATSQDLRDGATVATALRAMRRGVDPINALRRAVAWAEDA